MVAKMFRKGRGGRSCLAVRCLTGWGLGTERICRGGALLDAGNVIPVMAFCKGKILRHPKGTRETQQKKF